ncbi:Homeodomain-like protein [Boeremia exigua]|uniref:Homeodomain-like protein n=1 Tax=Boeremia exigua TaxID=749465 RepID=UPI001E8D28E6|nr:Homeodomain-like protein [Boeremia exigua]KAH6629320.1 Homeodomain-like protein [Boeremia exigua]
MSSSERKPRRWTPAEDETLREQVDAQQVQGGSRDWCQIALALPGRSNKDCRKRWHNSVTEGLKKGQWSKSEDQLLIHGVQSYSFQWTKVATCVSSRSADQCAKRWQQSLDPRLDRSEWRESEDKALLAAVESLGRHWKDIQEQYLPHRSKNCVKNRFSVLSRRNAIHLAPYDDSLGSSSSDPGTPLQLEGDLPLDFMTTSLMHNTTHGLYQQDQISRTRSVEMSWLWSGSSDPSVSLPASHFDSFDANLWPACPNVIPSQTLSSNAGQWNGIHTNTGTPPSVQYLSTSNPQMHAYSYPTHHPADSRGTQYVAPSTSSSELYAPAAGSSRLPTHRGAYGHSYRGS